MTFSKSLVHNFLIRLFNTIVSFLIIILLTRAIGASDFGILTLMIANASILNLVSSLGISSGITYNLASKNLSENHILSVTFLMLLAQLLFTAIFEIVWHLNGNSFWLFKGNSMMDFLLGICFFLSISVIEKYNALFYGKQQFQPANNITLITNLVLFLCLLLFSKNTFQDNYGYFTIYVVGSVLQAFVLFIYFHITNRDLIKFEVFNRQQLQLFFSYSFIAFFTNLLQFLAYRIDYWLVDYYNGSKQLGIYSVSVRLAQLFWIIPNLLAAFIFPKVAANSVDGSPLHFSFLIRLVNTFNVLAGLFLFMFSSQIIGWIFGIEYTWSVQPLQILLPGIIAFCITTVLAAYYAGINRLKVNFWGTMICLVVILILDLILIPGLGIKGAAIASSIGYIISTFYSIWIFKRLTKISFSQLLLLKKNDLLYLRELLFNSKKV